MFKCQLIKSSHRVLSKTEYKPMEQQFLPYLLGRDGAGNTKAGSITVPLTSCLTGLESAVWQLTIFVFI
jgi:hypothetical protein